jgi:uncharacterized membrane protein YGL010W
MRSATDLLIDYATYHRDQRNITTHFVGIPLIVFSIAVLLSRPHFQIAGWTLTPGWVAWVPLSLWYVSRGLVLGGTVSLLFALGFVVGDKVALGSTPVWLVWGLGLFVLGWVIQFLGHYYEGRKPAFVDDLIGLLVGPMFVTAEALFALGWNPQLLQAIEKRAGPPYLRDLAQARGGQA